MASQKENSTAFSQSFKRLLANWPVDEDRAKVLVREFQKISQDYGVSRFDAAVSKIIREGNYRFFPSISEFLAYMPTGEARQFCGKCMDGFVKIPDIGGDSYVRFCECRFR